jgi:hypothetical protein
MRYRIQVEPVMGYTFCVVTTIDDYRGRSTATTKMYTIENDGHPGNDLVEILGELQRTIGESQG